MSQSTYDNQSADRYHHRFEAIVFEKYQHDFWTPIIEAELIQYCTSRITLDLGCGTGLYYKLVMAHAKKITGIDASENMLSYCRKEIPEANVVHGSAESMPFDDASFETVFSIGMFQYVDVSKTLSECHRILKPGGSLIIETSNRWGGRKMITHTRAQLKGRTHSAHYYSRGKLIRFFKSAGFSIERIIMKDGLIFLPHFIEKIIGDRVYKLIERIFKPFPYNPFSQNMVFIVRKASIS